MAVYRVVLHYYEADGQGWLKDEYYNSTSEEFQITLWEPETPEGYDFSGWTRQDDGSLITGFDFFKGNQALEAKDGESYYLTANWKGLYGIKVAFYSENGGSIVEGPYIEYSEENSFKVSCPSSSVLPDKPGYKFLGWAYGGELYAPGETISVTGNLSRLINDMPATPNPAIINIVAEWEKILPYSATINLDPNGGTLIETEQLYNESYETDRLIFTLPTPQLTGQSFNGWLDSNSGEIYSSGTHTFIGSQGGKSYTLIAQWKPLIIYTYNFYFYDQSAEKLLFSDEETSAFKTISYNIEYTQPEVEFYEFYWYNSNFGYIKPSQTISVSIEDGNIAQDYYFTAIYIPITYKVTVELDVNEGTLPPDVNPILKGEAEGTNQVAITLPTPERPGYNFLNWAGNNTFYSAGTHNFTGSESGEIYKLVAIWKPKVLYKATVIFSPNGGIGEPVVLTQSKYDVSTFTFEVPSAPTREQHDFTGWADSATAEVGEDLGETITLPGGIVSETSPEGASYFYYAIWWKYYERTIIYGGLGTDFPEQQYIKSYEESVDVTLSSQIPSRQNYTFLGWAKLEGATKYDYTSGETIQNFKLGEVGYTFNLYAVWRQDGIVNIFINGNWVQAIPYIYDGEWKQVIPYVYESNGWHIAT